MITDSEIDSRVVCGPTIVINMRIKHVLHLLDFLRGKHCLFYFCGVGPYIFARTRIRLVQCYSCIMSVHNNDKDTLILKHCFTERCTACPEKFFVLQFHGIKMPVHNGIGLHPIDFLYILKLHN